MSPAHAADAVNVTEVVAAVLLGIGVLVVLLASVGLLAGGSLFDRLHYLTVASTVGAPVIVTALALEQPNPGRSTVKLVAIGALLFLSGPVVTMATGQAAMALGVPPAPAADDPAQGTAP